MLLGLMLVACHDGPRVIAPSKEGPTTEGNSIFTPNPATRVTPAPGEDAFSQELHRVVVQQTLPTERYVYLLVSEGNRKFWIAARKQEIKTGETYFYRGGLLKTHFESKEYQKVFDTMYLVTNLVPEDHSRHLTGQKTTPAAPVAGPTTKVDIPTHTEKIVTHKGIVRIAELVRDPGKYEGHTIQVSGTCVKINPNIMERNWIHLRDGSQDDYDLVITSSGFVPEGSKVTMKGVVHLNRDFGAGYRYDLILEEGVILQ